MMQRRLNFPIKGTFYYSAALAIDLNLLVEQASLHLVNEPDNIHDPYAMQIWLNHSLNGEIEPDSKPKEYLIGYVPKIMTKPLSELLQSYEVNRLTVTHLAQHGHYIEVDCELIIQQPLLKFIYLLTLAKFSQQSHNLKRLRRRWLDKQSSK